MKKTLLLSLGIFWCLFTTVGAATYGIGPHILISMPQENFANISGSGEGFGLKGYIDFKNLPGFSMRADLGFLSYGDKMQIESFYFVQTRNEGLQLSVGPQYLYKTGRFGAYFCPMIGIFNYSTIVSVPDLYYNYYNYSERRGSKTNWGWSIGVGLLYDIGLGPWIDLSAKYGKILNIVEARTNNQVIKSDAVDVSITVGVLFFLK